MKYENKKQVDTICEKIRKAEELLNDLSADVIVMLKGGCAGVFQTIGTYESSEHPYKERAAEFVDCLKAQVNSEITELKNKLAEL